MTRAECEASAKQGCSLIEQFASRRGFEKWQGQRPASVFRRASARHQGVPQPPAYRIRLIKAGDP
jgi:hypothetical protein